MRRIELPQGEKSGPQQRFQFVRRAAHMLKSSRPRQKSLMVKYWQSRGVPQREVGREKREINWIHFPAEKTSFKENKDIQAGRFGI
jgi:hypothetical protein